MIDALLARVGSVSGFRLRPRAVSVAAFAPHHRRLSTDPESPFVRTLVVQRPYEDRIVTLRSRTLSVRGPAVDSSRVLGADEFGLTLDGARVERLWALAEAQHAAFVAS